MSFYLLGHPTENRCSREKRTVVTADTTKKKQRGVNTIEETSLSFSTTLVLSGVKNNLQVSYFNQYLF